MSKYTITESVGQGQQPVKTYEDLEIHHPSANATGVRTGQNFEGGNGRQYGKVNGEHEEIRPQPDGRILVKKDFILSGSGEINVPAPVTGYAHFLAGDPTNALRLYDKPFGEPGAKLLAQALHMDNFKVKEGELVQYGQPMGRMSDKGTPGSVHAHVETTVPEFKKYINDMVNGTITQENYPTKGNPTKATPGSTTEANAMADGVLKQGEKGPEVKALQDQLIKSGITTVNGKPFIADSDYGPATKAAVAQYQQTHNLHVDGVAGKDTLAALKVGTPTQTTPSTQASTSAPTTSASTNKPESAAVQNAHKVVDGWQIGQTSAKYETSNRGPGFVSSGKGDYGGVSYGTYQLSTTQGSAQAFVKQSPYADEFKGLQAGTSAFTAKWKEVAKEHPVEFNKSQHDFIQNKYYQPQVDQLKAKGIDLSGRGPAVQDALWSTSVQFGGLTQNVFAKGLQEKFGKDYKLSELSDKQIVGAVQDYKLAHNNSLFSGSPALWPGLKDRAVNEKADLSRLADADQVLKANGEKPRSTAAPSQGNTNQSAMSDGMLKQGEKGAEVKALQEQLIKSGITTVNGKPFIADSDYGPATKAAVTQYQQTHNLHVDGVAGKDTLAALKVGAPAQTSTPSTGNTTQNGAGNWPAPGNFKINHADKAGEGEGEFNTSRGGGSRTHKGLDIEGKVGDPIQPFAAGKVIYAGKADGYGNTVIIDHGNGQSTRYAHLNTINVKQGQEVTTDTKIATMGRTGNTPSAGDTHLHFEIRTGTKAGQPFSGTAVDPVPYLKNAKHLDGTAVSAMSDGVLKQGEKGPEVKALQDQLIKSGITTVNGKPFIADSDYGPATKAAVTQYQQTHGLHVDGVAGKDTLAALKVGTPAQSTPAATPSKPSADGHDHGHSHGTTPTTPAKTEATTPTTPATPVKPAETAGISASLAASEGILMLGSKGADVTKLQEQLGKLGYTDAKGQPIKADGDFGQGTKEALMAFEKSRGMEQNGIVGPKTSEALAKAEQAPKLTEATHDDNKMFKKVDGMLAQLPAGTFKNDQERQNAAGAVVYEAKVSGMSTVDKVELNTSRTGLIVSEGNPQTTGNREMVKLEGAVSQSLDKSTQLIAQDTSKAVAAPAKVAEAPVKTNEQVEPQKVAVGGR